ncbi:MAG TPA: hypothetical protein VFG23_22110 [Polyangia bacterium]|nr:hypothetical protein [Polyangia bacterium]
MIRRFHGLYDAFRTGADVPEVADVRKTQPPEIQQRVKEWRSTKISSLRFSDGLVLYSSLARSPEHSPVKALYELICACGSLMLTTLAWGHPVRGGIDVGTGLEIEGDQLYGPAVVKAYELESKPHGAEYPRIVVGETLTDYLATNANKVGDVWVNLDAQLARGIRELLTQDADGHTIVDYMGAGFKAKVSYQLSPDLVRQARDFAAAELERFKREGNKKLIERYQRLVDYFERKADVWSV